MKNGPLSHKKGIFSSLNTVPWGLSPAKNYLGFLQSCGTLEFNLPGLAEAGVPGACKSYPPRGGHPGATGSQQPGRLKVVLSNKQMSLFLHLKIGLLPSWALTVGEYRHGSPFCTISITLWTSWKQATLVFNLGCPMWDAKS